MKTLDLIRYITQKHHQFDIVNFHEHVPYIVSGIYSPMEAINHLASIDPSNYDDIRWVINIQSERNTLLVFKS